MYARISRAHVPPEHFDVVFEATKARNVPLVRQLPRNRTGYWSADRHAGRVTTLVLLEGDDGLRAAEAGWNRCARSWSSSESASIRSRT
jgi:hypothetical protein